MIKNIPNDNCINEFIIICFGSDAQFFMGNLSLFQKLISFTRVGANKLNKPNRTLFL